MAGLEIKPPSPLKAIFTVELANGSEGYFPWASDLIMRGKS